MGASMSAYGVLPKVFSVFGNSLPSFFHVFSFTMITAGIFPSNQKHYLVISLAWISIDCIFELGQFFKQFALKATPNWFDGLSFLENTKNYFLFGTFDVLDLIAIALGGVTAYLVLIISSRRLR